MKFQNVMFKLMRNTISSVGFKKLSYDFKAVAVVIDGNCNRVLLTTNTKINRKKMIAFLKVECCFLL